MGIQRISFSYPLEMKEKLQKMAKEDNRSLSSFIQVLMDEGIKKREREERRSNAPKISTDKGE